MSHREAARAWGVSRATIQRAIKSGKLSLTPEKTIDPAEMSRVFGEPLSRLASRLIEPLEAGGEPLVSHPDPDRLTALEIENAALRAERDGLRELVSSKDETIAAMRLLTHDVAPRKRRWWPWGRG